VGGLLAGAGAGISGDVANFNTPNKTTTIVGSNLQANANNADNTNNGQININSQPLNILPDWRQLIGFAGLGVDALER
jgi:hypothetical protein